MAEILKLSRTEIVARGIDSETVTAIWNHIIEDELTSLRIEEEADGLHLKMYPFKRFEYKADSDLMPSYLKTEVAWDMELVMLGMFPKSINVIDDYWIPIRKCAKRAKEANKALGLKSRDANYVHITRLDKDLVNIAMFPRVSFEVGMPHIDEFAITTIRMSACNEHELHRATADGTVSADERVYRTLFEATLRLAESLRLLIDGIDPAEMRVAHLMDEISMEFAEAILRL